MRAQFVSEHGTLRLIHRALKRRGWPAEEVLTVCDPSEQAFADLWSKNGWFWIVATDAYEIAGYFGVTFSGKTPVLHYWVTDDMPAKEVLNFGAYFLEYVLNRFDEAEAYTSQTDAVRVSAMLGGITSEADESGITKITFRKE